MSQQEEIDQRQFYLFGQLLVAQTVKSLPVMRETWVRSLGQEDSLEKEMATHSNILAWRIPWAEESDGLQSMRSQRIRYDWATNTCNAWIFSTRVVAVMTSQAGRQNKEGCSLALHPEVLSSIIRSSSIVLSFLSDNFGISKVEFG